MAENPDPVILRFDIENKGEKAARSLAAGIDKIEGSTRGAEAGMNRFGRAMQNIINHANRVASVVGNISRSVINMRNVVIGAGAALGVGLAVNSFAAYEAKIREVATLTNASAEEIRRMDDVTKKLSITYGQLPVDTASAFYNVVSAGFTDAADSVKVLDTANKLAIAGVTDVNTAVEGLVAAFKPFGGELAEIDAVADLMFATVRSGVTTIPELSNSLSKITPSASAAGVQLKELLASIAAVTSVTTGSVDELSTQIAAAIRSSVTAAKELGGLNEKYGLDVTFSPATVAANGLVNELIQLHEQLQRLDGLNAQSIALQEFIPDSTARQFYSAITNPAALAAFRANMAGAFEGAVDDAVKIMERSAQFRLNQFKSAVEIAKIDLGGLLYSVFGDDLLAFIETLKKFDQFIRANEDRAKAVAQAVYDAAKATGEFILTIFKTVYNIGRQIVEEMGALGGSVVGAFQNAEGFLAGLQAAAGAVNEVAQNANSIVGSFTNIVFQAGSLAKELLLVPFKVIGEMATYFFDQFQAVLARLADRAIEIVIGVSEAVRQNLNFGLISDGLRDTLQATRTELTRGLVEQGTDSFSAAIGRGIEPAEKAFNNLTASVTRFYQALRTAANRDVLDSGVGPLSDLRQAWEDFQAEGLVVPDVRRQVGVSALEASGVNVAALAAPTAAPIPAAPASAEALKELETAQRRLDLARAIAAAGDNQALATAERVKQELASLEAERQRLAAVGESADTLARMKALELERQAILVETVALWEKERLAQEESINARRIGEAGAFFASGPIGETSSAGFGIVDTLGSEGAATKQLRDDLAAKLAIYDDYNKAVAAGAEDNVAVRMQIEQELHDSQIALDQQTGQARLALASSVFGSLGAALNDYVRLTGKQSKEIAIAQKVLAIAQATINTYLAATAALADGAKLGAATAITAASVITAVGAANVAIIAATPIPTYHEGGYVSGRGSLKHDEIQAVLQTGEYVLSRKDVAAMTAAAREGSGGRVGGGRSAPVVDRVVVMDSETLAESLRENTRLRGSVVQIMNESRNG